MVRLVAINGIWWQRALAPCVSTAYTVDVSVNVQIDKASTVYCVWMLDAFQIFLAIIISSVKIVVVKIVIKLIFVLKNQLFQTNEHHNDYRYLADAHTPSQIRLAASCNSR